MTSTTEATVLQYHQLKGVSGKLATVLTRPLETQTDLGLAYKPDFTHPVIERTNYAIQKPLERRVCLWKTSTIVKVAKESEIAQLQINLDQYIEQLENRLMNNDLER